MLARLCRAIKKNEPDGLYSLVGRFAQLSWRPGPVGFVCVVYWGRGNETFRQSFALKDEVGNLLDETPTTECVLTERRDNVSTAFFYVSFPRAGHYSINVYQNDRCIEDIPLEVVDTQDNLTRSPFYAARFRNAPQG